jgi:hypothetical protein
MKDRITKIRPGSSGSMLFPAASLLALGLVLLGGCDETSLSPSGAAAVAFDGKAAPGVAPPAASIEAAITAYDQCYSGCYTAHTNATNRETCKLECDSLAEDSMGALADPAASTMQQHLRGCLLDCWDTDKLSETNRSTCRLTCVDDAVIATTPLPKQTLEVVPGTVLTPDVPLPVGAQNPR